MFKHTCTATEKPIRSHMGLLLGFTEKRSVSNRILIHDGVKTNLYERSEVSQKS